MAEAVLEEENPSDDTGDHPGGSLEEEEEDVGSDSDSECGDGSVQGMGGSGTGQVSGSLEASLWSLDISATSSMETSVYETEVGYTVELIFLSMCI